MTDAEVRDLLQRSGVGFVGTVLQVGTATVGDLPVDDRTAVVRVDTVVHAPPAFLDLAGSTVTLQMREDQPAPDVGERATYFADALAFGDSLALTEVGRVPEAAMLPHLGLADGTGDESSVADLQAQLATEALRQHADSAAAIVVGRVTGLAQARPAGLSEHDPHWWLATVEVEHVERGPLQPGPLQVLYANSIDVTWRDSPKPKAGQSGVWVLHAVDKELEPLAAYRLSHPEDLQGLAFLDAIRPDTIRPDTIRPEGTAP